MIITKVKITIIFTFFCFLSFSQDIIIKKNGDSIIAKVKEMRSNEISFHKTNNLNGPVYIYSKSDILKIVFENGTEELLDTNLLNRKKSINQIKKILKKNIDLYCYDRSGKWKITTDFEGDYLRFYFKSKEVDSKSYKRDIYNFAKECLFHTLSKRKNDIAYINAYIPRLLSGSREKWSNGHKLIIRVHGHDKAEEILDAMKEYHYLMSK